MKRCLLTAAALASVLWPSPAIAQETAPPDVTPRIFSSAAMRNALGSVFGESIDRTPGEVAKPDGEAGRRCPGCPVRRLVLPYLESIGLDAFYNTLNRVQSDGTANVSFTSVWHNLRHGFEWDENGWGVNQIGHPYQGSNYFTSARAHGLTFWESTPVAAFGSATWEFLAENNRASLNDLVNTTLGGIALGEVMHRIGWLIRDPAQTGKGRGRKEMIAMAVDPMGGLQRLTSGDRKRVAPKPDGMIPSSVTTRGGAGVVWQGRNVREARSSAQPFLEMDMDYGDVRNGRSKVPFEAFTLEFTAGGGSPVSLANVRGRYFGAPFGKDGKAQFSIFQTFDYSINKAYAFGGQGVEVEVAMTRKLSPGASLWMAATGGSTILGAVDTLLNPPVGVTVDPDLLKRRTYDYGPTIRFGGVLELQRNATAIARLTYQGYQLNVVDGTRSFHVLQRMHLDIRVPLVRALALGVAGEYFFRKAYFWPEGNRTDQSPQFRIFAAWRQK